MDWFPLYNSIRVAVLSTAAVFFTGVLAARHAARLSVLPRAALDALFMLPLALPPTAVGWLILRVFGPRHLIGHWVQVLFGVRLVMSLPAAVIAAFLVSFPLTYRAARIAFSRFDQNLEDAAYTLGCSDFWTFWMVQIPVCRREVAAGAVLAFARAMGEYGATMMAAGYVPDRTATIATSIDQLWRAGDSAGGWVFLSIFLSAASLLAVSLLENGWRFRINSGEEESA